jgi:hypothetical protein
MKIVKRLIRQFLAKSPKNNIPLILNPSESKYNSTFNRYSDNLIFSINKKQYYFIKNDFLYIPANIHTSAGECTNIKFRRMYLIVLAILFIILTMFFYGTYCINQFNYSINENKEFIDFIDNQMNADTNTCRKITKELKEYKDSLMN